MSSKDLVWGKKTEVILRLRENIFVKLPNILKYFRPRFGIAQKFNGLKVGRE